MFEFVPPGDFVKGSTDGTLDNKIENKQENKEENKDAKVELKEGISTINILVNQSIASVGTTVWDAEVLLAHYLNALPPHLIGPSFFHFIFCPEIEILLKNIRNY